MVINMGTRNITSVVVNGEQKVCQYCQWDGYPTWAGAHIMEFLKDCDFEQFKKALENTKINVVDYDDAVCCTGSTKNIEDMSRMVFDIRTKLRDENPDGSYPSNEDALKHLFENGKINEQQAEDFYVSTRDTGCAILPFIYNRSLEKAPLELFAMTHEFNGEFASDIQGVYILNLDKMTLDMTYNGYNKVYDINNLPADIDCEMLALEETINVLSSAIDYGSLKVDYDNLESQSQSLVEELIKGINENEYIKDVTDEDVAYIRDFAEKHITDTLKFMLLKEEAKSIDNVITDAEERAAENKLEDSVNRSEIEME